MSTATLPTALHKNGGQRGDKEHGECGGTMQGWGQILMGGKGSAA